jgi:hypothetical protein
MKGSPSLVFGDLPEVPGVLLVFALMLSIVVDIRLK